MNWSKLTGRTKALIVGAFILVLVIILVAFNIQRQKVGADILSSGAPALDTNGFNHTIAVSVNVTDQSGAPKAAFVDAFLKDNSEDPGITGDAPASGQTALSLVDSQCYTLRAQDKNSTAEGTVTVAVGKDASCGADAIAYTSTADQPVVIKIK